MVIIIRKRPLSLKKDENKKKLDSFDQKLQDFETRVNNSQKQPLLQLSEDDSQLWRVLIRAGVELFSVFVVGVVIGFGLDYWLSTRPIFMIIFSMLGISAGVLNVWRIVKPNDISLK